MQNEAVALIASRMDVDRNTVFKNKWLDVESLFENEGWKVNYDKPGYCESYEASFKFTRK